MWEGLIVMRFLKEVLINCAWHCTGNQGSALKDRNVLGRRVSVGQTAEGEVIRGIPGLLPTVEVQAEIDLDSVALRQRVSSPTNIEVVDILGSTIRLN